MHVVRVVSVLQIKNNVCVGINRAGSVQVVDEDSGRDVIAPGAWHVIVVAVQLAAKAKDASLVVYIDGVSLPAFRHTELCDLSPVRSVFVASARREYHGMCSDAPLMCCMLRRPVHLRCVTPRHS